MNADPSGAPRWPDSHASASAQIAAHLPGSSRARLRPIGEGDFCLAFRQHTRVVRVAKHAEAAAALKREACLMSRIAESLPLPVPKPTFHQPAERCAFSSHERIPGAPLTRARWERLPPAAREAAAAELGQFLAALHALPTEPGLRCGLPVIELSAYATALRPAALHLAAHLHVDTARRLEAALTAWSNPSSDMWPAAPSLLHRDIAPGHVLFNARSGRLTGVIDFGDLAVGDPARDFVYIYEDFGETLLADVLRSYAPRGDTTIIARIHVWYLLETLAWTVEQIGQEGPLDDPPGLRAIVTELDVLQPPSGKRR
jgi:aminoglycoside phosphotransferase (APT) family kinase protein